jgi:hypothetical protein
MTFIYVENAVTDFNILQAIVRHTKPSRTFAVKLSNSHFPSEGSKRANPLYSARDNLSYRQEIEMIILGSLGEAC